MIKNIEYLWLFMEKNALMKNIFYKALCGVGIIVSLVSFENFPITIGIIIAKIPAIVR